MPAPGTAGAMVLRVLRVGLHVSFAVLLGIGLLGVLGSGESAVRRVTVVVLSGLLAALYLAGTLREKRHAAGLAAHPGRWAIWWLGGVVVLWVILLYLSSGFAWLAFPLFFLHLHILGLRHALFAVVLLTAVDIAGGWYHSGSLSLAQVLGPALGAVFAVIMGMAYRALYQEGVNQRLALAELRETRAALAEQERRAGTLSERARLAREIHDTLAQGLSSIVLVSRAASAALESGNTDLAAQRLETIGQTAAENLAEARGFVRGLSGDAAQEGSLAAALERLCAATERNVRAAGGELECSFAQDGTARGLPEPVAEALLRAAQSGLANIASHAGASRAVLSLGYLPDAVTLDVFDDGIGLDTAALPRGPRADGTGYGLAGLRERLAPFEGTLEIESTPGEGTVIAVRIPLPATEGVPHG
ncbi:sensor histidine kinase [Paeniglutamicibacter cryotolerans]